MFKDNAGNQNCNYENIKSQTYATGIKYTDYNWFLTIIFGINAEKHLNMVLGKMA